jgi:hypothetical protein
MAAQPLRCPFPDSPSSPVWSSPHSKPGLRCFVLPDLIRTWAPPVCVNALVRLSSLTEGLAATSTLGVGFLWFLRVTMLLRLMTSPLHKQSTTILHQEQR